MGEGQRATIADVARRAGVSKGLVSFALNDRPGVAPDTRRRILEAAEALGWSPSVRARALSVGRAFACRSEEHTSELQSLMRTSYAVFRLKKKKIETKTAY